MNIKYLSIISSIGGILILYMISLYTQIPIIAISEIEDYDGQTVTINGSVIDYHTTSYGNQIITIQQHNDTLALFVETPLLIQKGDLIQATGMVQQYQDDWELIIDTPELITIQQTWENNTLDLSDIAKNPTHYLNQNVNVTAYVDLIYDHYFQIIDEHHHYLSIAKRPYIKNLTLSTGQHINLNAYFTYDPAQTRYLFEFTNQNHTIIPVSEKQS